MKTKLLFTATLLTVTTFLNAQGTWTKKADFGGGYCTYAAGFSIGTKGYIGTAGSFMKDFWEYDSSTDTWTQKADFDGVGRYGAVGFSIGAKGYIGTGWDGNVQVGFVSYKDFWEYDPAGNIWRQKADFGGGECTYAVGFSIGAKGYIGTGYPGYGSYSKKDFWEYDPFSDTWTQKADFGGTERYAAVGLSIGAKGYIGTGDGASGSKNDFWEYDPSSDTWTQKADFGGAARGHATGFSIGAKGYIGTGWGIGAGKDFWEYDPSSDTWTQKADFGGAARHGSVGFSIGAKGYIGTGFNFDFWEYDPSVISNTTAISIEENQQNNISIYPNPFSNQATLKINSEFRNGEFRLYDALGNEVKHLFLSPSPIGEGRGEVERGSLPAGIYFYKVTTDEKQIAAGKLMIE